NSMMRSSISVMLTSQKSILSILSLAKRFKNFRRFLYQYEAETLNGVNGATNLKNGPKVEIDVPQTCSFILRTTECSLSEVVDVDTEGSTVFAPAAGAEAFQAAMAKYVMVEGQTGVKLFPEEDETTTILNIKRGIVSALIVPALEEEKNKDMATLHGVCGTNFAVNSREDIATDVTVTRDLSKCDSFIAQRDHTSPLAIISGMQYPLSKLISSTQTCNYKFDNQKKHMTAGSCTEKHIFLPFSHQTEYGVSTLVKQTLTLLETSKINERVFNHNEANLKGLPMEAAEDKAAVQTADAALATLRELSILSETNQGHQRASIFQKLVSELRGLKGETMSPAVPEMVSVSDALTWQALAQCGTPECSSAMLQHLRTFEPEAMEVDAAVYALGLLPNPSRLLVKDILINIMVQMFIATLLFCVTRLYQTEGKVTPEIAAVSEFLASLLGADCAGEKELTFLTLRIIGNIGEAMEAADATVKTTLLKCMRQPTTTLQVQLAAIQAFRRMSVTDEVRSNLQRVSSYAKGAVQKRLAAYLILMRTPEASDLELVKKILKASMQEQKPDVQEQNAQVKAFVTSHIYNIIHSNDPETIKYILDVLADPTIATTHGDYTTMSRNYKMDAALNNMKTSMQGNMIFDPTSQLPKEIMLETTLKAFGYNMDMWEIGMEGKDFEPTIEALFGKNGFFPDTVSKAMYWAGDKMPDQLNEVLKNFAAPLKNEKTKVITTHLVKKKLAKDLQAQESPEAMAYLRIMGTELGYIKGSELKGILKLGIPAPQGSTQLFRVRYIKNKQNKFSFSIE
uniref:Vitellogenin domain-containing protein n=1 Tax=Hucho hucho TaxID=62062 RepID=A0A4W5MPT2_9TELE